MVYCMAVSGSMNCLIRLPERLITIMELVHAKCGRVLYLRPKGCRLEPHRRHCVVVLEQDTFILA